MAEEFSFVKAREEAKKIAENTLKAKLEAEKPVTVKKKSVTKKKAAPKKKQTETE